ncbi:MAG TPA: thioesterase family protein [Actinomycetota bacterium]
MFERRIPIRWRDMDAYGHVNNAVYLTYLEECRDAWAQSVLGRVSDTWDFVLAHVGIDYRSQLTQDDREVVVRCWLASYGRSSVRTREEIRTDAGVLSANAESVIVPRDPRALTARRLSDEERAVLDEELARDAG